MGFLLDAQGQLTPWSVVRSSRNSNSFEILYMSLLSASIKRIGSKATEKRWRHQFPHYKSMGVFCCHGHQSFDPICPKTLRSLSAIPMILHIKSKMISNDQELTQSDPTSCPHMLHIKFDQDWPTGFRAIQVGKVKFS